MILVAVALLVLGICILMAVVSDSSAPSVAPILGVCLVIIGAMLLYLSGHGQLSYNLYRGDVREVVCSAPLHSGAESELRYATLLRKPDGEYEAVILFKDPPKHFVFTGNKANPYVPYPGN